MPREEIYAETRYIFVKVYPIRLHTGQILIKHGIIQKNGIKRIYNMKIYGNGEMLSTLIPGLSAPCAGQGRCGKCRLIPEQNERARKRPHFFSPGRAVVLHKQSGPRGVLFVQHSILISACGCDNISMSRGNGH